MNIANLAQKTNFIAGSDKLKLTELYLTTVNLPGVTIDHPELSAGAGAKLNLTGDNITYNTLSFNLLVDEDFLIYHEFMGKIFNNVNPESGSFANIEFDFWVQINNSKGHKLFKIDFTNCRVESIEDIEFDTASDETEFTLDVEIKYDYFTIDRGQIAPKLAV